MKALGGIRAPGEAHATHEYVAGVPRLLIRFRALVDLEGEKEILDTTRTNKKKLKMILLTRVM